MSVQANGSIEGLCQLDGDDGGKGEGAEETADPLYCGAFVVF